MLAWLWIDRIDNSLDRDWVGKKILSKTLPWRQDDVRPVLNSDIDKGLFSYFPEPAVQFLFELLVS